MFHRQSNTTLCLQMPRALLGLALVGLLSLGGFANADEQVAEIGAKPIVAVQVDLSEFAKSDLGKLLVKAGTNLAAKEMGKDPDEAMTAVMKSIGFNPLEQEIKLVATVADLEDPLEGLRLDIRLKDSTGNLEGLLLAAPEYRTSKHNDHTLHEATLDGQNLFVAFYTGASGRKHISVAGTKNVVTGVLDSLKGESTSDGTLQKMSKGQFVNVRLLSMPEGFADVPPLANIGQMVSECSLSLREETDDLVAKVTLATKDEEQSIQLQQLAQGMVAMIGLFKEEIRKELDDDAVASRVIPILDQIKVDREGIIVTVQTRVPESLVVDFLREEADLPL